MGRILDAVRRSPRVAGGVAAGAILLGAMTAVVIGAVGQRAPAATAPTATPSPSATSADTPIPQPTHTATPTQSPSPSPTPTPEVAGTCPLDGMPLADARELVLPALAVQVENHPAARPARNLSRADMVVETTVEGDTTRFTGIFLCDGTAGMTGPIRSARYYNIDLWQDLRVLTVGFGRSDGAHARFVAAGMPYPDGMTGWPWYQRWGPRAAPHNLYVDLEALREALTTNAALAQMAARVDELRPPFSFDPEAELPPEARSVREVRIATAPSWRFGWTWDADAGDWLRSDAGQPIVDEASGERLAFRTLLVQRVTQETVHDDPDPGGHPRRLHHLVGRGEGTVYVDGRAFDLRWERQSPADGTRWTHATSGEPVVLPPGPIWWHILPTESRVSEH